MGGAQAPSRFGLPPGQQRALVSELSTRRQELLCDVRNLHTKHAMVELARRAGWVLRGETLVVVNDVPDLPDNPC